MGRSHVNKPALASDHLFFSFSLSLSLSLFLSLSLSLTLSLSLSLWFFETGFLCISLAVLELTL